MRRRVFNPIRRGGAKQATAAAIVEFAVVLPLLLAILFGIIEYGWVFMVRQTLQHASREGCRLAVLQTSVDPYANVTARVADIMSTTNAPGYTLNMVHAVEGVSDTETVTVSVQYADISLVGGFFGTANYTLTGSTSMRKEGLGGP